MVSSGRHLTRYVSVAPTGIVCGPSEPPPGPTSSRNADPGADTPSTGSGMLPVFSSESATAGLSKPRRTSPKSTVVGEKLIANGGGTAVPETVTVREPNVPRNTTAQLF